MDLEEHRQKNNISLEVLTETHMDKEENLPRDLALMLGQTR